jgi:hypothetical protein
MPSDTAVFDLAENEYRGHKTCSSLESSFFDIMIGPHGTHIGNFFNAMLGGEFAPNPTSKLIPQIAYRTPGELAFNIELSIKDGESENFDSALGCWDITDAISTFNPMDFTRRRSNGIYINPNRCRQILKPGATPYWPEVEIRKMMRSIEGTSLSRVIRKLENKYPTSACFIILSCCMGIEYPERLGTEYPEQPSAYTHYALKGEAVGEPAVDLDCSMTCRELDENIIDYGDNPSLSMVLRSSDTKYIKHVGKSLPVDG